LGTPAFAKATAGTASLSNELTLIEKKVVQKCESCPP